MMKSLELFHLYRANLGYGIVASAVCALGHWKHGDTARESFVDVLFCGAVAWSADSVLQWLSMPSDAAVIASAMLGYIGADGIASFIKKRLGLGG